MNEQINENLNPDLEEKFRNTLLLFSCKEKDGKSELNYEKYRNGYYIKSGLRSNEQINEMCRDYIKTLIWIKEYYTKGISSVSWAWRYPYFYAPLLTDLYNYLKNINPNYLNYETLGEDTKCHDRCIIQDNSQSVDPFLQLLYILPPRSKALLPIGYQKIFLDQKFYPIEFEVDYQGKRWEHEAVVKLQLPELAIIEKRYNTVTKCLEKKYPRNKRKEEYIF